MILLKNIFMGQIGMTLQDDIQQVIIDKFGGDEELYRRTVDEDDRKIMNWKDLELFASTFPEYDKALHDLIELYLGYVPALYVILPYGPFIKGLIRHCRTGLLAKEKMLEQIEDCIKQMRNEEVINHVSLNYKKELYKKYEEYLPQYREKIKARLTRFLGYEPQLQHSISVEITLRLLFVRDRIHFSDEPNLHDFRAINVITYREILLEKGKEAADCSELFAMNIRKNNEKSENIFRVMQ